MTPNYLGLQEAFRRIILQPRHKEVSTSVFYHLPTAVVSSSRKFILEPGKQWCSFEMGPRKQKCDNVVSQNRHFQLYSSRGGSKGGRLGRLLPLKPMKVTLFAIILYNSEKNIRDITPFFRPSFCHSSVVKYTSSLLQ